MTIYDFMGAHPFLAFILAWIIGWAFTTPFRLFFRHLNIRAHGWPPDYLDADGDIHRPDDEDEKEDANLDTKVKMNVSI